MKNIIVLFWIPSLLKGDIHKICKGMLYENPQTYLYRLGLRMITFKWMQITASKASERNAKEIGPKWINDPNTKLDLKWKCLINSYGPLQLSVK